MSRRLWCFGKQTFTRSGVLVDAAPAALEAVAVLAMAAMAALALMALGHLNFAD
jgi:hypothetical protein